MSADDLDRQISEKTNRGCLLILAVIVALLVGLIVYAITRGA